MGAWGERHKKRERQKRGKRKSERDSEKVFWADIEREGVRE